MSRLPRRRLLSVLTIGAAAVALAGCYAPLPSAGKTDKIEFVSTSTSGGWKFDYYRNRSYPCSISGYQTFVIGTKVGSSDTQTRPLWVRMRGGGVGWFDANGNPQPSAGNKSEESAATSISFVADKALTGLVRGDPAASAWCRSRCATTTSTPAATSPTRTTPTRRRTASFAPSTACSPQRPRSSSPSPSTPPARPSCTARAPARPGSSAWLYGMQLQGVPPAGAVADSGVVNVEGEQALNAQGVCSPGGRDAAALEAIRARLHPDLAKIENEPDKLIRRGELTVPFLHTWSRADPNVCGAAPVSCPLRDGSSANMGAADCIHEPAPRGHRVTGPGQPLAQPAALREPRRQPRQLRHARGDQQGRRREHRPGGGGRLPRDDHGLGPRAAGRSVGPPQAVRNLRTI